MPQPWKIFYTDDSELLWNEVRDGNPKNIPIAQRIGVHSVVQPMDNGQMREVIEQYHYIFSIRDDQWLGVGLDGLLDQMTNDLDNISCVMHGRTMATDKFWSIKQKAAVDTDIVGGVNMRNIYEDIEGISLWLHKYNEPYWQAGEEGRYYDPDTEHWVHHNRHRAYDPRISEPPRRGEQTFTH